ncbi:DGQHR domain-containing protein [Sphingomonas sp. C3-2]|uniref:DGQHR domain-containing protein n=1 Tax=Sphingomonas sp. C3-2 TaxID=3062169 RepID=UPI00294AA2CB|nr:DGQHR domain-containing protein [Sphingomonas sp. C3-2]WOK36189.1 DGQHR domain-containing protein [Sphingomonas sp. C3-2]
MASSIPPEAFPLRLKALRVDQPIGSFFAVVMTARMLLELSYTKAVSAELDPTTGGYNVSGTQRLQDPKRLSAIADYIDQVDATFPNSIILAANFRRDETRIEGDIDSDLDDEPNEAEAQAEFSRRWIIEAQPVLNEAGEASSETYELVIPTGDQLARVIDGQHRLFAFAEAEPDRLDTQLLCAIFMDLPPPMQATIFATINSNQKPVDKSLTYELFGYNVSDERETEWSPEKLAVFLARRLATDTESRMAGRIAVAPINDFASAQAIPKTEMKISFATIVGGIVRLISSNPKADANKLKKSFFAKRSSLGLGRANGPPFRQLYLNGDDVLIYAATRNFVNVVDELFWREADPKSFIRKTVGVQALFDVYREIAGSLLEAGDLSEDAFRARLAPARKIDFANVRFQNASGSNRTAIRRIMRVNLGLIPASELPPGDEQFITQEAVLI